MKKYYIIVLSNLVCFILNAQGTWTKKSSFPDTIRAMAVGFSIGCKGYICTGYDYCMNSYNDLCEWDAATNTWTRKANIGGSKRYAAVGFSIGTKAYVGTGFNGVKDFWEWDQPTNTWTQKADFGGGNRYFAVGFSIGTKGYVGTGTSSFPTTYYNDFWEYDPIANSWIQKADFGGSPRKGAVGFSIGTKGYIGTGNDGSGPKTDFWEWNQASNTWAAKTNFPGTARNYAVGFSIGTNGYIGTGENASSNPMKDIWSWNQITNLWMRKSDLVGIQRENAVGFSIGNKGYITTGASPVYLDDLWEFDDTSFIALSSGSSTICSGENVSLTATQGDTYLWSTGETTVTISVTPTTSTTYSLVVFSSSDCFPASDTSIITITTVSPPVLDISGNNTICMGQSTMLTASGTGNNYLWSTGATNMYISVSPSSTTTYSLTASIGSCSRSTFSTITVHALPSPAITGTTSLCIGDTATLTASGGINYLWNKGATTSVIKPTPTATTAYSVKVTDANGCSATVSTTVTVFDLPAITYYGNNMICLGQTTTIQGYAMGTVTYSWNTGATTASISVSPSTTTTYTVTAKDANGCRNSLAITVTVNGCTGISTDEDFDHSLIIYPNPSGEQLFVQCMTHNVPCTIQNIEVYNIYGKNVYSQQNANSAFIPLYLNFQDGIYFLQVKTAEGMLTKKIVIQK